MTRDERLSRLETVCRQQAALCDDLIEQIAEANLKIRFVLSLLRVAKRPANMILGADGKSSLELTDGYVAYMAGGREAVISVIEKEIDAAQEVLARAEAEAAIDRDAGAAGAASGEGDSRAVIVPFDSPPRNAA